MLHSQGSTKDPAPRTAPKTPGAGSSAGAGSTAVADCSAGTRSTTGAGGSAGTGSTAVADDSAGAATIADIIAEFSEVFAFARTRWMRYAEEVDPELRGAGIIVLQFIKRKGPVTATGISQMLDMDKAVVSRQISKLRELGLVEAEPAPEDRRVLLLEVSGRAQGVLDDIKDRWAHAYHERFEGWSDAQLESLRDGLHRFNASADQLRTDGPARRCARAAGAEAGTTTDDA